MRAEELVAEVYRQKLEVQEGGGKPRTVHMPREAWEHIRAWHISLGIMEKAPHMDYIGEESIFGLAVEISDAAGLKVV